jgi:protein TonB
MPTSHYRTVRAYQPSSSRYAGFVFVVGFHILLAIFLVKTLNHRNVELIPQDVKIAKVEDVKPKDELPPPPPPDLKAPPPPPFVPPVEVNIQAPAAVTNAIQQVTNKVAPPAPPPPPVVKAKPSLSIDRAHTGDTDRYYPPISKRLGEEGSVIVQVAVAPDGHVVDAKVAKSSGFSRLDAAALEFSKSSLHYVAFTYDEPIWVEYKVVFQLR